MNKTSVYQSKKLNKTKQKKTTKKNTIRHLLVRLLNITAKGRISKPSRGEKATLYTEARIKIRADFSPETLRQEDCGMPSFNVNLEFYKQQNAFEVEGQILSQKRKLREFITSAPRLEQKVNIPPIKGKKWSTGNGMCMGKYDDFSLKFLKSWLTNNSQER